MKPKIIDLFAGAGGLSTGFHLAGFESVCAIDLNKKALETYKYNYPQAKIVCKDIREINIPELKKILGIDKYELSAIIGGPPCQGFSRNIPSEFRHLKDPRNQLYQTFLEFVKEFMPRFVVMENVPEILNAYDGVIKNEITVQLESLGYKVNASSLNAAHYGVPQTRSRAFFISSLSSVLHFPKQTHYGDIRTDYRKRKTNQLSLLDTDIYPVVTVKDAIGDLPSLEAGQKFEEKEYPNPPASSYQAELRKSSASIVNHIARPLSDIQMKRVLSLKEGQDARDLPPELAPKKHYSGAYGRLYWDKPARTITRWVFHPGSGRFFHPTQNRTITIREAARLHSYPDWFHFLGTFTEMASQIGESVPPLLSKAIADCIIHHLRGVRLDSLQVVAAMPVG